MDRQRRKADPLDRRAGRRSCRSGTGSIRHVAAWRTFKTSLAIWMLRLNPALLRVTQRDAVRFGESGGFLRLCPGPGHPASSSSADEGGMAGSAWRQDSWRGLRDSIFASVFARGGADHCPLARRFGLLSLAAAVADGPVRGRCVPISRRVVRSYLDDPRTRSCGVYAAIDAPGVAGTRARWPAAHCGAESDKPLGAGR